MSPRTLATFDMVQRAERAGNQTVSLLSRIVGRGPEGDADGGLRLRFCGLRGADLRDSALCREPDLLSRAEAALLHGYPVILSGHFVPGEDGPPQLVLSDIQPALGALDLLCPRPEEAAAAAARLAGLRDAARGDPDALAAHVLREAQLLLGLRSGASPRYRQVQRAVLLQALSGGGPRPGEHGDGDGGRLALLTLSRPGRAKRTLALLAQLLAPVAMIGQGATLTPPELTALVTPREGGGLVIEPGMLVRGDGGIVVIEDFHALRRHREPIQRALGQAIEEGRVVPLNGSGAGEAEGDAQPLRSEVAIYIDLSLDVALHGALPGRTSQTLASSPDFATDLLSRMDVIACVDAGNDAARSARGALWTEADRPPPQPVEEDLVQRRRELQLLVALVRDEIPHVELDPVAEELVSGFFDRSVALGDERGIDAAAFVRRSSLSLRRLCAAAARLRLRDRAGPEDAQLALALFSLKIETLTWLFQARG